MYVAFLFSHLRNLTSCDMFSLGISLKRAISFSHLPKLRVGHGTHSRKGFKVKRAIAEFLRPESLSLLCPSPSLLLQEDTPTPLLLPVCSLLTHLSHIAVRFGHEVRRWRRANGNVMVGLGVQRRAERENRWEQQEAVGRHAESGDRQHLYPSLMSPGQFWLCVLPPHRAAVPSVWNVLVAWNACVVQNPV